MNKLTKYCIALLAGCALAVGCGRDDIDFGQPDRNDLSTGRLSFEKLTLDVSTDTEIMPSNAPKAATRIIGEAPDNYLINILDAEGAPAIETLNYGQLKETPTIELRQGAYTVTAQGPNYASMPDTGWETPAYYGSIETTVRGGETTEIDQLICHLANIKTTVDISADLKDRFKPDDDQQQLLCTLSIGDKSLAFGRNETRAGFFRPQAGENTLQLCLSGLYNTGTDQTPEYVPIEWTQEIKNVKAGQWRKISIQVVHSDSGNISVQISVETWVYDQPINVDVMSKQYLLTEEEIDDDENENPDPVEPTEKGPRIFWSKDAAASVLVPIDERHTVTPDDFPVFINIASESGITGLTVEIVSEVLTKEVLESLGIGLTDKMDLVNPASDEMDAGLHSLGFKTRDEVLGATSLQFDITEFMPMLYGVAPGDTDFKLTATDASGETLKAIMLYVPEQ